MPNDHWQCSKSSKRNILERYQMESPKNKELNHIIENWKSWMTDKAYSYSTYESYDYKLNHFLHFVYSRFRTRLTADIIRNLDSDFFRSWVIYLHKSGYTQTSKALYCSAIRNFFKFASRYHALSNDSVSEYSVLKPKRSLPYIMGIEEAKQFIAFVESNRQDWIDDCNLAIILLMYGSGLSIAEALNITYTDIKEDSIFIRSDEYKSRNVTLHPITLEAIERYITSCPFDNIKKSPYLFQDRKGNQISTRAFYARIKRICENGKFSKKITPITFRHSCIVHLLSNMGNLRYIQNFLGHNCIESTRFYEQFAIAKNMEQYNKAHPRAL